MVLVSLLLVLPLLCAHHSQPGPAVTLDSEGVVWQLQQHVTAAHAAPRLNQTPHQQ